MLRITFGGEALEGFPPGHEGANVKLLLPHHDQTWPDYLESLKGGGRKPRKRTYTVASYREATNELDLEFALHASSSPEAEDSVDAPATSWALSAQVGDQIGVAGPGRLNNIDPSADWFLLAGDMTALPAIKTQIQRLPVDAVGSVFLAVSHADDQQAIALPTGITLHWLPDRSPQRQAGLLVEACLACEWRPGIPGIWIAGEAQAVRQLRKWLVDEKQVEARYRYTSGYWHLGETEDSFQVYKRQMEQGR